MAKESASVITKHTLFAGIVLVGFALFWAVVLPAQTKAWQWPNSYWPGVFALWALVAACFWLGNKFSK
ncbi:hypothetical protein [Hymenobacter sp. UYP22]|uniref:hypothetical protein n=1 Tax=Hymenobacter sp. UYP22 TaxID=3156348 RepID=UPI003394A3C4